MASDIVNFYSGKNIFVTGASGLLGKVLVEKLLWSCPAINAIHILLRGRRGSEYDLQ
jgi:alcohol-forming fatty acyl-CoA reductase